jgi:hypothetical protein
MHERMNVNDWTLIATFGDRISAQALVGLLDSEQIPCRLISNEPLPGLGSEFAVMVPPGLLARATRIRAEARVSEQELTYLATGETPGAADKESLQ